MNMFKADKCTFLPRLASFHICKFDFHVEKVLFLSNFSYAYLDDLVDWYAQMARDEATHVQTVPATANQNARPMEQVSPSMNGPELPEQYLSLIAGEPQPAG